MIDKVWKGLVVFAGERWKFIKESWALCLLGILIVVLGGAFLSVMFFDGAAGWLGGLLGTLGSDVAESGKERTIQLIGWGIGGLLLAIVAVLNKLANAQVKNNWLAENRVNAQVKNNELVEKGHIQARFKAATEHLGGKNAVVRIASFYEFLYLAKDNKEYRESILDILCAYLRQTTTASKYTGENKEKPNEEVQSLLDILFKSNKNIFSGLSINLQRVHLQGASLREADLRKIKLQCADLRKVDLCEANLQGAYLWEAKLQGAKLQGVDLREARLQGTKLQGADLQGANLWDTNLQGADLQGAKLISADLQGADLQGAKLQGAKLQGANLWGANLWDANLLGTKLQGAYLWELGTVKLKKTLFRGAKYDNHTKFPDKFNPSYRGMVRVPLPADNEAEDEN